MMKLYEYWRSSAAYRVRIALNLKGIEYSSVPVNIAPDRLEQTEPAYAAINPQMRVPSLELPSGEVVGQSMAIIEYLDELYPEPALLPGDAGLRLKVRVFADIIACDVHPLNNSSVLGELRTRFGADADALKDWYISWIAKGFAALETIAVARPPAAFLFGETPTLAEICLVPQISNARRFDMDLSPFPRLVEIDAAARTLPAFAAAAPELQPGAL
jgi:maleylacetoacetate isomerase